MRNKEVAAITESDRVSLHRCRMVPPKPALTPIEPSEVKLLVIGTSLLGGVPADPVPSCPAVLSSQQST